MTKRQIATDVIIHSAQCLNGHFWAIMLQCDRSQNKKKYSSDHYFSFSLMPLLGDQNEYIYILMLKCQPTLQPGFQP